SLATSRTGANVKRLLVSILVFASVAVSTASAQTSSDDPAALKLAEPDFTLIGLPTSLRLPKFGSAFRVTHRFTTPLNGDFGDLVSARFGVHSGAQIGLEYRFGLRPEGRV